MYLLPWAHWHSNCRPTLRFSVWVGTANQASSLCTSLKHTLNQGCMQLSAAQVVSWSSSSCLDSTCISFSMPTLLWSHGMKGSGSSTNKKKNYFEEERIGRPCELSSMNWPTIGVERHQGGQSSRTDSLQAAGQDSPRNCTTRASAGCPPISSDNCTNKWLAHTPSWKLLYCKVNFPLHQQAHLVTPPYEHSKFSYTVHRKHIQSRQDFSTAVQLHVSLGCKITW